MSLRGTLKRVKLDDKGRDAAGQHFGPGEPVYKYDFEDDVGYSRSGHVRAKDRAEAKRLVREIMKDPRGRLYGPKSWTRGAQF